MQLCSMCVPSHAFLPNVRVLVGWLVSPLVDVCVSVHVITCPPSAMAN